MPPMDGGSSAPAEAVRRVMKETDSPNPRERARIQQRLRAQRIQRQRAVKDGAAPVYGDGTPLYGKSGTDRVLVILVEFAGTNTFTWTPGTSTWDPLGRCDYAEFDGTNIANAAASQFFAQKHGITSPTNFTYAGPLHNTIARPLGTNDPSKTTIWMPDFNPAYYSNLIWGNGIVFDFTRQDGSRVQEDFTGLSVRDYYEDFSGGEYSIAGTILGWVKVTNSVWYYGADGLPGRRSCPLLPASNGGIPGAGNMRTLVMDALKSAKTAYPGFDWASFDQDGDSEIDRLWIIHAGLGEEDSPTLLDRAGYGEGAIWSSSWRLASPYEVVPGVFANTFIMMPENAGIAVLAHEFAHNLGALDLYTYGDGQTSAGFWTLMADDWAGFPLGFLPQALDPMHMDEWGWLSPLLINDPTKVYSAKLGQASRFPSSPDLVRGVKIELPDRKVWLRVQPHGQYQWWGGQDYYADGRMTLRQTIHIPSSGAMLEFQAAYDTEAGYDFFHLDASTNSGASWQNLAKLGGRSAGFPNYQLQTLSLNALANRDVLLRFRYTTDDSILGQGPFVDDIAIRVGTQVLLTDDAEQDSGLWTYTGPWARNSGQSTGFFAHHYYLQWRNTSADGGYDRALGDTRFRFGPVNSGLLVWYQDDRYSDNGIADNLTDAPSFGPKGRLLVVDSHPEPDLDPYWEARGVSNERGIVYSRGSMRDAPFSRWPTANYQLEPPLAFETADFAGRSAAPQFSDAQGYYPGLQHLAPNLWGTWQWDASTVLPSVTPYGVRGPAYPAGTPVQMVIAGRAFVGTNDVITYQTNLLASGLNLNGGEGNPGAVGGQCGWKVRVVHQTNSWAEVVIWNGNQEHLDDDQDGAANWQEAVAGTEPDNPESFLRITQAAHETAGQSFYLELPSATNRTYRFVRAAALQTGFETVAEHLSATPPVNSFHDPVPPLARELFYRIEVE